MGTKFTVKIADGLDGESLGEIFTVVHEKLQTVNGQMSTWQPDSELSRFNTTESTDWFPVSADVVTVVREALRVSELTGGKFDVTVGPLIQLWGFDRDGQPETVPTQQQIDAAKQRIGFSQLEIRADPPALRKQRPDLYVNLSAIAKGYGVDVLAGYLEEAGVENYMVEIGGEVRTKGAKPGEKPWVIGIERPETALVRQQFRSIAPGNLAMATSGDYRNFFEQEGKVYSHTIDPHTGNPIESNLASVTLLAPTCMRADALATAIMVLGPDAGMALAKQEGLPVMLLIRDDEGNLVERSNTAFQALVHKPATKKNMTIYLAAFVVFAIALTGMAIGVIISNRRIKGSCGGLNNIPGAEGSSVCDTCTTPPEECDRVRAEAAANE